MMYWKSLLLALKWSGPSLRVFIPNTSLFRPWWDAKQWFLKNFCITSFPLTLYDLFPPLIFFSLLPSSFSSLLQIPFFPCKILYIFRVSCLVSSALKKKRIENTSQVQQISDILIAGPLWNVCIKVDTPQTAISVHHPGLPNLMIYVLFHLSGWCHFCRIQQVHWTILGAKSQLHCISAW